MIPLPVHRRGFTLVEVMVSTALVVAIMALLLTTVDQTQRIWQRSRSKTTQFQSARTAFESMARRMSQATLNTYWMAREATRFTEVSEFQYRRQSELQFISGPTTRILGASPAIASLNEPIEENYPTHAVFFHAPLGVTEYEVAGSGGQQIRKYRSLDSMLSACGYFIEFGPEAEIPNFLAQIQPPYPANMRYRLMELNVPSERFNVYLRPTDSERHYSDPRIFDETNKYYEGMIDASRQPNMAFVRPLWMKESLKRVGNSGEATTTARSRFAYSRAIADNVIALIVLPKLATKDRVRPGSKPPVRDPKAMELAPFYEYDSWRVLTGKTEQNPVTRVNLDNRTRDNLLPPIVQITMIALDEPTAARVNFGLTGKPNWTGNFFKRVETEEDYLNDMQEFEKAMNSDPKYPRLNYRVFTTDVVIRGSKWSRDP